MSNLYQRIGEAMTSQGKITLVLALDDEEAALLRNANFVSRGFVDINGSTVEVFDATKTVVHTTTLPVQNDWWTKPGPSITPFPSQPWTTSTPRPYTATYTPEGTGVAPNTYRGSTTSLTDAAYDPLSVLEDYYYENIPDKNTVLNINVEKDVDVDAVRKMIDEYQRIEASKK